MTKIVHVGLPKCASTSLQVLFAEAKGTTYLGKGARPTPIEQFIADFKLKVLRIPTLRGSNYITKAVRDVFRETLPSEVEITESMVLECRRAVDEGIGIFKGDTRHVLISDEVLSGAGFIYFNKPRRPLEGIIEGIGKIFGSEALVVVVMRSQISFLVSYWKHLVRTGYPFTFGYFLSQQSSDPVQADSWCSVTRSLFYDRIRRKAEEAGVRVAFVPFEDVVKEGRILREVFAREGVTLAPGLPHRRQSNTDESHIRKLKRNRTERRARGLMFDPALFERDEAVYQKVLSSGVLLDETPHQERLIEAFRPENRAMAEATGYDLKAWKYPV
ncbi:hypothetical protein [Prosthecomicrobium sp. N25]|uniref:hypothetical protein n=1 Tax=Prosthecomicrobium sp. N25 TaxID=3129254 RepID=UPI003077A2A3